MSYSPLFFSLAGVVLFGSLLSSCGSGGGGSSDTSGTGSTSNILLGTRDLQETTITAYATTPLITGAPASFEVDTTGTSAITNVTVMRGLNYEDTGITSSTVSLTPNSNQVTVLSLPAPSSSADVLLARVTFDDGSEAETAIGDFTQP